MGIVLQGLITQVEWGDWSTHYKSTFIGHVDVHGQIDSLREVDLDRVCTPSYSRQTFIGRVFIGWVDFVGQVDCQTSEEGG